MRIRNLKRELVVQGAKWGVIASLLGSLMFGAPVTVFMLELYKEPIESFLELSIGELLWGLFLFVGIPGLGLSLISFFLTAVPGAFAGILLAAWFDSLMPQLRSEMRTLSGVLIGSGIGGLTALLVSLVTAVLLNGPPYFDLNILVDPSVLVLTLLGCIIAVLIGGLVGWRLAARY